MGIGDLISSSLTGAGLPELLVYLFFLGVGLVMIIKGGDGFVDAASWFAEISGIPKLIVGATVVSLATTLPELLVSLFAAADGHPAEIMDMSFAIQALSAQYLAQHRAELAPGVIPVPRALDEAVARIKLAAMGVAIDTLSTAQEEYLGL